MLEELRADAKAGVLNQVAPWRRRLPETAVPHVEEVAEPQLEQSSLSPEAEAQLANALELALLGDATMLDDREDASDPIMPDLLSAIGEALGSELENDIRRAVNDELRQRQLKTF